MVSALGQLPNAPLVYVLSQIAFTRIPNMETLWENYHQSIFSAYPESFRENIREIKLNESTSQPISETSRWHMVNRDNTEGLILGPDSLTFHATAYNTSADFFQKIKFVINSLEKILPDNIEVKRVGLRYVDLLIPNENLAVESQVEGKLGSIPLTDVGCEFQKLEEVTGYSTPEGGQLIFRHRQSITRDLLPGDLFPNNLKPADRLSILPNEGEVSAVLDFDHFVVLKMQFDTDELLSLLQNMHKTSSKAFQLTTTPEAKALWKEVQKNDKQ